jgi:RNA polymerase sigma factor (sigma-70 family)
MHRRGTDGIVRHLRDYLAAERTRDLSDGQLLHRFVAQNDESAFACLVGRHGPLVMGVCRRVLRHEQDAEDAFQATFLILARRASSLDTAGSLAGYLHTVAHRAALKARAIACRRGGWLPLEDIASPQGEPDGEWWEVRRILDEEIARLPEKYRAPLVLCDLGGKTHGQAGREIGQPAGSMSRLLARGRELLRDRLLSRGVALPAGGLVAVLAEQATAAEPFQVAAGSRASAIARAVLADMSWASSRVASVLVLAAGLFVAAGLFAARPPDDRPAAPPAAVKARVDEVDPRAESPLPARALLRLGTSRFRHAHIVSSLVWSRDGKTIFTGSHMGTIREWDAKTGKDMRVFRGHTGGVIALAVSSDGKLLASGSWDRSIRLWDTETGKPVRVLMGHIEEVCTLCFSPTEKVLASGSKDGTVRLWDTEKGNALRTIAAHKGEVRCVTFSNDGKRLATASTDRSARIWEAETGNEVAALLGHKERVTAVAFSPDDKTLATCSWDRTGRLWNAAGKETRLLKHDSWLESVAFSRDGNSLAISCGWGAKVALWDLKAKKDKPRWVGNQTLALKVAFSPDGKKLAGSGWESAVRVWDVATGREEGAASAPGHTGWVYAVVALPDGKTVVSAGSDRQVLVWDAPGGRLLRRLVGHMERVNCLALSPDGKTVASGGRDQMVILWDIPSGTKLGTIKVGGAVKSLAFSPDGRRLGSASGNDLYDGWVTEVPGHGAAVWEVATQKRLLRLEGHTGGVNTIAFSPDGKQVATGGNDRTVRFWDSNTGKELRQLPVQAMAVDCLAYSPDGATLATGGGGGVSHLWEASTGKPMYTLRGPTSWAVRLAFSRDGGTLIVANRDDLVQGAPLRLWDVATGKERVRFAGHQRTAFGVAFSPDGRTIVSGGGDGTLLVWDVTGRMKDGKFVAAELTAAERDAAWSAVLDTDGAKVHQAIWALVAAPKQALPLLKGALKAPRSVDQKVLDRLIRDLDDDAFAVREKATRELEGIGEPAVDTLRKAMKESGSAEVRDRAERLLSGLEGQSARDRALRLNRGLEVLEHIGTAEARRLLKALAAGPATAVLTQKAKAALKRMGGMK